MKLEPVIGLEIHIQLKTHSKMFCSCDNRGEYQPPNTTVCPVCLGHPGTLPVPNAEAINMAGRAALALNLHVNNYSKFDRKNYFYPDLPKGYQISQFDEPLAQAGYLDIETSQGRVKIGLERLHLEEDTAKLLHSDAKTLVDFNRAGTPLMEIVTKPELKTPEQAKVFLQELRLLMRYLDVSEADMEMGHLRCDANISLRMIGETKLYPKTEIKNLNSFRAVAKALTYEIARQTELWNQNKAPTSTATRGWDEKAGVTVEQRDKEALHDYRYFPEPDIPSLQIKTEQIKSWRESLPELPSRRRERLQTDYGIGKVEARLLTEDKALGDLVLRLVAGLGNELEGDVKAAAKLATNWMVHKLVAILIEKQLLLDNLTVSLSQWIAFLLMVARRQINSTNAQVLMRRMIETGRDPETIVESENLLQVNGSDTDLAEAIKKVIANHPDQVAQFKAGKEPVIKFLLGALMRETKGRLDPQAAEAALRQELVG